MSFWKKIFGGDEHEKEHDDGHAHKDEARAPSSEKDAHDKEHNGENKKPKNVCEFC